MENTNNNAPRRPNPRRRKRSRMKVFKQVYLPVIIVGLVVLLFIVFAIGSIKRSNEKRAAAREESLAQEASQEAELEVYRRKAAELMVEADVLAKNYDYEGAIAVLDGFLEIYTGNLDEFQDLMDRRESYVNTKNSLVAWDDPSKIVNLGFNLLIADSKTAFADEGMGSTYKYNNISVTEFNNILAQLYQNGYVLVNLDDIISTTVNDDGTVTYAPKTLYLPEGKTPFMITQSQVNYYSYMVDGNDDGEPDKKGDGFAYKLTVKNGKFVNERINSSGELVTGDYDLVPALETFIADHPDFSYMGARAILTLTGYDGLFGYRGEEDPTQLIQALRDAGYIIGCNTYRNKAYGAVDTDEVKKDLESWETTITPILGQTNIFAFAKQSDIAAAGEAYSDKKFEALTLGGYSYFLGFCDDGQPWMRIEGSYIRQGRLMVTGNTLEKKGSWFTGMFDAASVMERGR